MLLGDGFLPALARGYRSLEITHSKQVSFNPSVVATPTAVWTMGDGNSRTTNALNYTYAAPGTYTVRYVGNPTALTNLWCYNNSISVLDVSALTALTNLACYNNSISVLDVSALTALTYLACYSNSISVLDVSALTALTYLHCANNTLPQAQIDAILAALVAHGNNNGTLACAGSGNAAPSAVGITNKNILISRGWSVTTN